MSVRSQGTTLFTAILILVGTTVVVQLWLLTVSTEALLSGQTKTLIPAAAGSSLLLLINSFQKPRRGTPTRKRSRTAPP